MFINSDIIKMADRERSKYFRQMQDEEPLLYNELINQVEDAFMRIKNAMREEVNETSVDKEIRVSLSNIAQFVYTTVIKANDVAIEALHPTINNSTIKSYDTADSVIGKLSDESDDVDSNMENIINEENKNN